MPDRPQRQTAGDLRRQLLQRVADQATARKQEAAKIEKLAKAKMILAEAEAENQPLTAPDIQQPTEFGGREPQTERAPPRIRLKKASPQKLKKKNTVDLTEGAESEVADMPTPGFTGTY